MIWPIIFGFATLFFVIYGWISDGFGNALMVLVFGFFVTLIGSLFIGGLVGTIMTDLNKPLDEITYIAEIVVLRQSEESCFYVGSGPYGEDPNYYYLEKTDRGIQMNKHGSGSTYIRYTTETPTIEVHELNFPNKIQDWFGFNQYENYVVLSVPANSVLENFEVDFN